MEKHRVVLGLGRAEERRDLRVESICASVFGRPLGATKKGGIQQGVSFQRERENARTR